MIRLLIILLILFSGCSQQENIEKEIEKAKFCSEKEDCVVIESKCPFGCYIAINKNEKERIENLINNFESKCIYGCVEYKGFDCINNKCTVLI